MEKFIAQRFQNQTPSEILKVNEKSKKYNDVINLSIGDPDLSTDKRIIDGMYNDTLNGETHYANPRGLLTLREEIVKCNKEDYDINITTDEVFVATSATHAMFLALTSIINCGDEVILFGPYFTSYKSQVELVGGKVCEVSTFKEDDYQINFDLLEKTITTKTKAIIINTPCNPTGKCLNNDTLVKLNEIIKKYNLVLICDEIYTIFTYTNPFTSFLTINPSLDNIIIIRSCSKDFVMTGFRMGYVIADKRLISTINQINEVVVYSAPTTSQNAYIHALKYRKEIYPNIYKEFKQRSEYAYHRLKNISFLDPVKPDGTIYIWVDIRKTNMTSLEFTDWFLEKYHLLVLPGHIFGESGEGFVRFALTVSIEKLKEAFDRIEE